MPEKTNWYHKVKTFEAVLSEMTDVFGTLKNKKLSRLEKLGLISYFEFNYELAWRCMKDFFEDQGDTTLLYDRDVIRLAFRRKLIDDGEIWMDMLKSRMKTEHYCDDATIKKIARKIIKLYYLRFLKLLEILRQEKTKQENYWK